MGLQQLKLGDKVRLKIIQPMFKCSGRSDVKFQTRGKITDEFMTDWFVEFRSRGKIYQELFDSSTGKCKSNIEFSDLYII